MIRLWIDTGATYAGTYAAYGTGQVGGCWRNNEPIREMADDWPSTPDAVARAIGPNSLPNTSRRKSRPTMATCSHGPDR
ncbi:MAG: hypothetical protein ACYSU5_19200 [Planctomycetota bacterium]